MARVGRLVREQDGAEGARDVEGLPVLREGSRGPVDDSLGLAGPTRAITQNSSPPSRYAAPRSSGTTASFSPSRASNASPAGWPKPSLYALKPSRSKSMRSVGRVGSSVSTR